jgi:subtilisin-like proprotein convertase family protein
VGRLIPPSTSGGSPTIDEFPLAPSSHPVGIAAGPDGNLWIAEDGSGKVARMTPAGNLTGDFTAPGPPGIVGNGAPGFITAGADGNLWLGDLHGAVERVTTALDPPAFRDASSISVPDSGTIDPPPTIPVSGLQGTVTGVTARLTGISHTFPDDLNILLEGPRGQTVMLASDVGSAVSSRQGDLGGNKKSYPANGITLNFSDSAPRRLSDTDPLVSGFYKPTNIDDPNEGGPPEMLFPAPLTDDTTPFSTSLSSFNGTDPNGTWTLWITDDHSGDSGKVYGGWGLDIATTGPPATQAPPVSAPASSPAPKTKCKKAKKRSAVAAKKCKKHK